MPGFTYVSDFAMAEEEGRYVGCGLRKAPTQPTVAGWWADLSGMAGNPKPNYYASTPLAAAVLDPLEGMYHGPSQSPSFVFLARLGLMTPTAGFVGQHRLLDYVLYYPFIDGDEMAEQTMVNTVTLPRYTDGKGLQVMAVALALTTGSGVFTFNYVNQDGVEKTSPAQGCTTTAANIASIVTSQQGVANMNGWALKLASGDTGVRRITSATFSVTNGGLIALVLVKPLASLFLAEINTAAEITYVDTKPGPPQIIDGAYLNLISNTAASVAGGTLSGYADFYWR